MISHRLMSRSSIRSLRFMRAASATRYAWHSSLSFRLDASMPSLTSRIRQSDHWRRARRNTSVDPLTNATSILKSALDLFHSFFTNIRLSLIHSLILSFSFSVNPLPTIHSPSDIVKLPSFPSNLMWTCAGLCSRTLINTSMNFFLNGILPIRLSSWKNINNFLYFSVEQMQDNRAPTKPMTRKTLLQYLRISHSVFLFNLFRLHNSSAKFFSQIFHFVDPHKRFTENSSARIFTQNSSVKFLSQNRVSQMTCSPNCPNKPCQTPLITRFRIRHSVILTAVFWIAIALNHFFTKRLVSWNPIALSPDNII